MSTVINTNLASLFAQNSLTNAQNNLATSVQRLSSGLRINSAKDDAAGLAISQNMQSQINGTNQSINNLSNATNLLQTADSSLSTIQDMLLQLKQLSVQGYDGSLNATQKADIVTQMQDLNTEINATASRTQFNGINLLTSGSSIDNVNSDLTSGTVLSNTKVAVSTTSGLGSVGGVLADTAYTAVGGNGVATTFTIALDATKQNSTPGTYTFQANGANLTMTGTWNGVAQSQTVVINPAAGNNPGGALNPQDQTLDFSNFGVKINLHSQIAAGATESGQQLAASIVAASNQLTINGQVGQISNLQLGGVAPGTYQMSYDNVGNIASVGLPANIASGATTLPSVGNTTTVTGVNFTGGSGTGATGSVTYDSNGKVTGITMTSSNATYKAGDVLSSAAQGTAATDRATFGALAAGDSITVAGLTLTAGTTALAAVDVANAFVHLAAGATAQYGKTGSAVFGSGLGGGVSTATQIGTFSGTLAGWGTATAVVTGGSNNQLDLTATAVGLQGTVGSPTTAAISGGTLTNVSTHAVNTTNTPGVAASYTNAGLSITAGPPSVNTALAAGDQLTVDGLTLTATGAMSATDVAAAFAAASTASAGTTTLSNYVSGNGHVDGLRGGFAITAGTGTQGAGSGLVFTATTAGAVGGPTITGTAAGKLTLATPTLVAGGTAAINTVAFGNLAAGDSFTLAGQTYTASQYTSGTDLATAFASNSAGTKGSFNGTTLTGYSIAAGVTGQAVLTATGNSVGAVTPTIVQGILTTASVLPTVAQTTAGTLTMGALSGIAVSTLSNTTGSNQLTLTGQINGQTVKQSVTLTDNAANSVESVNFSAFGVKFDINSNQAQSANDLGFALANLNGGSSTGTYSTSGAGRPGQIVVATGNNSNLQFQSGANSSAFIDIQTLNVQTGTTGANAGTSSEMMTLGTDITGTGANGSADGTLGSLGANDTIASWQAAFQATAAAVDKAVDYISTQRATYGSQMNRLSYISSNLTAQSTNLQTSKSSITDTNFAAETATLTKGQIMQQAATAMLAQANQMPNVILSLLK